MQEEIVNRGVIIGHRKSDFVAGALPYEVRNPSGDWLTYLTKFERQYYPSFDTMACVSFSANQCCEMQIMQQTGVEVNLSDRFLAKMSGTTMSGNWLYIVADTLRKIGTVHEEEWPALPYEAKWRWEDYYTNIPQFVIDKAKKQFLDKYVFAYEVVPVNSAEIAKHLKHAPLQLVIPGHAVAGIALKIETDEITYFDTYEPGIKKCKVSQLSDVWKLVLTVKKGEPMIIINRKGDLNTLYAISSDTKIGFADFGAYQKFIEGRNVIVVTLDDDQFLKIPTSKAVIKS